jgi:hypothetical protein
MEQDKTLECTEDSADKRDSEKKPYKKPELEEPKNIRSFCATDLPI